jgi:hypothetical protein
MNREGGWWSLFMKGASESMPSHGISGDGMVGNMECAVYGVGLFAGNSLKENPIPYQVVR